MFVRGWVTTLGTDYIVDGTGRRFVCAAQTEAEPVVTWWVQTDF